MKANTFKPMACTVETAYGPIQIRMNHEFGRYVVETIPPASFAKVHPLTNGRWKRAFWDRIRADELYVRAVNAAHETAELIADSIAEQEQANP